MSRLALGHVKPLLQRIIPYRSAAHRGIHTTFTTLHSPKRTKVPKIRKVTKKQLKDLPTQLIVDGEPISPLTPWSNSTTTPASSSDADADEEGEYEKAVRDGHVPRTSLAREVWMNMKRYEGDILLTRVGMFYESYFSQAAEVAGLLGIRLTSKAFTSSRKSEGPTTTPTTTGKFPFAGFPVHQKDKYFPLLLDAGRTFVVVEEAAPSAPAGKGEPRERFVARRFTQGTLCNESWVTDAGNRYLLALVFPSDTTSRVEGMLGMAYIDVSTDRAVTSKRLPLDELEHELTRVSPVEIIVPRAQEARVGDVLSGLLKGSGVGVSYVRTQGEGDPERQAIDAVNEYLRACLKDDMPQLLPPNHQEQRTTMRIDASTLLGLEIRHSLRGTTSGNPLSRAGTLLSVIKRTLTCSGTRLLINTLTQPSADRAAIVHRHALVHAFVERPALREDLRDFLRAQGKCGARGEVVRVVQRFSAGRRGRKRARVFGGPGVGNARDLVDLREQIGAGRWIVDRIGEELVTVVERTERTERLREVVDAYRDLQPLVELVDGAVERGALDKVEEEEEEPREKGVWWLKPDFNQPLRDLDAQLQRLEERRQVMESDLQQRFNTPNLELKTSPLAPGLFVHVPTKKSNLGLVEADERMIPLRTNKTAKTYLYSPWTVLGMEVQEVHERVNEAQEEAFDSLREQILAREDDLLRNAALLDELDLTLGFAQAADELRWVRPEMQDSPVLDITNARHPTVEYSLMTSPAARPFVPNDLRIDPTSAPVHVITGPNMGGKSTVLRQAAIVVILAQAGSFVPADEARVGVVDAVFSRVGARDDLVRDMSTFMLEMHETAYILAHATSRSLVIMDEIGRGTTYHSGIAIAYATLEHILRHVRCRTLFATHYHELCDILQAEARDREGGVEYWFTDLDESDGRFSYSYRLEPGVNRESHAIKTAQQARMPRTFLDTVERMLGTLEGREGKV